MQFEGFNCKLGNYGFKHLVSLYDEALMGLFCSFMILRVGIELPTIEVRFEHLNIEAEAYVGTRGLPTVLNFTFNILEVTLLINMHLAVCNLLLSQKF